VRTNLLRAGWGGGGTSPEAGARTPVYLATEPTVASTTGLYFADQRPTPASALARDEALQEQFWEVSEQLVKSAAGDQGALRHY
jgi:hypothetical protein